MGDWVHTMFVEPITITGVWRLVMLVPLALMVSVVYKTIRCSQLSAVPLASLKLCTMIVGGMMLIGGFLMVAFRVLV